MKWLCDANLILDVLLNRAPHAEDSGAVWRAVGENRVTGFLSAHVVTTIYYMLRKARDNQTGQREILLLVRVFRVAPVDAFVIERALSLAWPDFEDAVSAVAAERAGCDLIVTRDPKHFRKSVLAAHTPESAMALLSKH